MNFAVSVDEAKFSSYQCDYVHVAGKQNVLADAKSRGRHLHDSAFFGDFDIIDSLRRLLGVLPAEHGIMTEGAGTGEADVLPHPFAINQKKNK